MVGPGDERTRIEGRSYVRASHADRERVIEELKAAFIQGRLEKDELDLRVGKVLASRTYADLNTLTADLPVRPAVPQPPLHLHPNWTARPPPGNRMPGKPSRPGRAQRSPCRAWRPAWR